MHFRPFAAAALLSMCGTHGEAAVYVGERAIDGATARLLIVTDDTLGVLAANNIVDWNITLTNSAGTSSLRGPLGADNSAITFFLGSSLSATATDLIFDFEGNGLVQWDDFGREFSTNSAYCLVAANIPGYTCAGSRPQEVLAVDDVISATPRAGQVVIASVQAPVPEPAAWAMMVVGFAAIGVASGRRQAKPSFG